MGRRHSQSDPRAIGGRGTKRHPERSRSARKAVAIGLVVLVSIALIVPSVLLFGGALPYGLYIVRTGSMSPTIPTASAVIVHKGFYRVGQVITFNTVNGVVTHRLVARNSDGSLVTKGDANHTADPGSLQPSQVIGGAILALPKVGYWLVYLKTPAGLAFLCVILICVWLAGSVISDVVTRPRVAAAD